MVFSMTQSLNGRSDNLPSSSADSGATPLETAISKVAKTSIGQLDEAGLSASDVASASSSLVGTMVGSLDDGGLKAADLSGAVEKITSGATSALSDVSGVSVGDLSSVIEGITSGATGAWMTSVLMDMTHHSFQRWWKRSQPDQLRTWRYTNLRILC